MSALRGGHPGDEARHHTGAGGARIGDLVRLVRTLAWVAIAAAIYQELRKPPEERTWHGKVAGTIPYDFRVPTIDRFREAYWDPDTDRIFSEKVIGVGWAVNIPVAARKLSEIVDQYADVSARLRADASARLRGDGEP
ncbi:MAG TPA: hypothetical protein VJQ09_02315 [Candidatus Limnocylindria bacterium]|nr:hypothetical protein [Candidatus Limnocylindria bacterium]